MRKLLLFALLLAGCKPHPITAPMTMAPPIQETPIAPQDSVTIARADAKASRAILTNNPVPAIEWFNLCPPHTTQHGTLIWDMGQHTVAKGEILGKEYLGFVWNGTANEVHDLRAECQ